jgi:hypothetical protein
MFVKPIKSGRNFWRCLGGAILMLALLAWNAYRAQAVVGGSVSTTSNTTSQLGLTGVDATGKSGVQLSPGATYYLKFVLTTNSDISFVLVSRMQFARAANILVLQALENTSTGSRLRSVSGGKGSSKTSSIGSLASLSIRNLASGTYVLAVSYMTSSGASSPGYLTWRTSSFTGNSATSPLPCAAGINAIFGQLDKDQREQWYKITLPNRVSSLSIASSAGLIVSLSDNPNSQAKSFSSLAAGVYLVKVSNPNNLSAEYTLTIR